MILKEKICLGILIFGLVILAAAGIFAYDEEVKLLSTRNMAQGQYEEMELLNHFAFYMRDLQRMSLNYVVLRQDIYRRQFGNLAVRSRDLITSIRRKMKGCIEIHSVLKDAEDLIAEYEHIVNSTDAKDAKNLERIINMMRSGRPDIVLDRIMDVQEKNLLLFSEKNEQISDSARQVILAIRFFIIFALVLILISVIKLLRYFTLTKRLLMESEELKGRLEEKSNELESVISVVSHDLRAPLVNIKGFANELKGDMETLGKAIENREGLTGKIMDERIPEAIHFIVESADTMNQLASSLVKVARAGQLPVNPEIIDMNKLVSEITKNFEFRLKEINAEVERRRLPDCIADIEQTRQIFSNIVDNAIKYREPIRPLRIIISGEHRGENSVYCIEDNGMGIAQENIDGLFAMYHQLKGNNQAGGEGLGLAIVKKMVERNKGKVHLESESDIGSRFFVELPFGEL